MTHTDEKDDGRFIGTIEAIVSIGTRGDNRVIAFEVRERNSRNRHGFHHAGIPVTEMTIGDEVMVTAPEACGTAPVGVYNLFNRRTCEDYFVFPATFYSARED